MDIKRGDAEADSYKYYPMEALLTWWETIKKDNHCKHCHDQRKNSPFVISVNGMLRKEALVVLAQFI